MLVVLLNDKSKRMRNTKLKIVLISGVLLWAGGFLLNMRLGFWSLFYYTSHNIYIYAYTCLSVYIYVYITNIILDSNILSNKRLEKQNICSEHMFFPPDKTNVFLNSFNW